MIYVTHDQVEAMTLADKIVVLRAGNIEQIGKPLELYNDPDNQFVAGFVGSPKMNFLRATVVGRDAKGGILEFADQGMTRLTQPLAGLPEVGSKVVVGVRAEHFGAAGQGDADLRVKVDVVEHLGSTSFLYARTAGGENVVIEHQGPGTPSADEITVSIQRSYLFDSSGRRLR
jgi:lactose/L-arabinose transport system ATP-binding protein